MTTRASVQQVTILSLTAAAQALGGAVAVGYEASDTLLISNNSANDAYLTLGIADQNGNVKGNPLPNYRIPAYDAKSLNLRLLANLQWMANGSAPNVLVATLSRMTRQP